MQELKDLIPIIQSLSGDAKTAFVIYLIVQVVEYCIIFGSLGGVIIYGISRWYSLQYEEREDREEFFKSKLRTIREICYEERRHPSSHSELIGKILGVCRE